MKKILILALTFLVIVYGAKAQTASYNYSTNYYSDADYKDALDYPEVINMLKYDGYKISEERYATLKQDGTAYLDKTFYANLDYIIIGISNDINVSDIDLDVYSNGYEYTKDDKPDEVAVVHISPYTTRTMRVVIKNAGTDTPDDESTCRFVIAYK